jgi:uncharacterized protein (TIGR03435 family)
MLIALSQSPPLVQSQTPSAAPLMFDAAAIRPSTSKSIRGSEGGPGTKSPTLYRFDAATLLDLTAIAWDVQYFQVSSTSPLDRQTFDLTARLPEGATKEQFRIMLQNLLAERFALKTHLESRDFQAYELVVAKSGFKLKEAQPGEPIPPPPTATSGPEWPALPFKRANIIQQYFNSEGGSLVHMTAYMEPLPALAKSLSRPNDLPVVDRTGLSGAYTFRLEYAYDSLASDVPAGAPDLSAALKDSLGLELLKKKVPYPVVVVDSFNKLPTEN